jgi:hypothetical protein
LWFSKQQGKASTKTDTKLEEVCEQLQAAVNGLSALDLKLKNVHSAIAYLNERVSALEGAPSDSGVCSSKDNSP